MKPYSRYTSRIQQVVDNRKNFSKSLSNISGFAEARGMNDTLRLLYESPIELPTDELKQIAQILGVDNVASEMLGQHQDFSHIKEKGGFDYSSITSVVIDIKNSTHLHRWYNPMEIYVITNTIQCAAIHTCLVFGGHIQRLQGDGVFVYFGGKNVTNEKAVFNAINASSFFTHFVQHDLKEVFAIQGIEDISTRIGIDFGYDEQVLWAKFGFGNFSEVTTLSLHTSLAFKMQEYAPLNGIVIGDNVKSNLPYTLTNYMSVKDEKYRYIYQDTDKNFHYTQWAFNCNKYLKSLSFLKPIGDNLEVDDAALLNLNSREIQRRASISNKAFAVLGNNASINEKSNIIVGTTGKKLPNNSYYYDQSE